MTPPRRPPRSKRAGFTLIEAVVATALMATILFALATVTAQWLPNWNRGLARVQRDADLALGLDRLVADLAAAEFISGNRQTLKPYFDGARRSVTLVRTALSPNTHSGLEIVRFAEVSGANGPILVRTQAAFIPEDERNKFPEPHFSAPVSLIGSPYRISFSYAGADRVWRDNWQNEALLPNAVRLTVQDAKTQRTLAASTATLLHVEMPADCFTAKSLAQCLASLQPRNGAVDGGQLSAPRPGQSL
jgi:general secretion pathway protein J